jgi:hypothetical protein
MRKESKQKSNDKDGGKHTERPQIKERDQMYNESVL